MADGQQLGLMGDPRMAGLLGAGMGLLRAAGPSRQKTTMGGALGSGASGLLSGWLGAEQMMRDREFMDEIMNLIRQQQGNAPGTPMPGQLGVGGPLQLPGATPGMDGASEQPGSPSMVPQRQGFVRPPLAAARQYMMLRGAEPERGPRTPGMPTMGGLY